ncbi:MAG: SMP-30/gluconolactonase/LRE family protein [Verrucomicrobiales bacterium]|nr:SMP-30/gluconolactonase/LRE family protein [Verrucomicrobiales bacterium]
MSGSAFFVSLSMLLLVLSPLFADEARQEQRVALVVEPSARKKLGLRALDDHWIRLGGDYAGCEGAQWQKAGEGVELIYAAHHDFLLFRWSEAHGLSVWKEGTAELSTLRPSGGGYYAVEQGTRRLLALSDDLSGVDVLAESFEGKRLNRPNDLRVRPGAKTVWFTDPNFLFKQRPEEKQQLAGQYVFCYDPDEVSGKNLRAVIRDLKLPNGIAFNEDGSRLFIGDSKTRTLWMYPLDDVGEIQGEASALVVFERGLDGISLAPDGRLWVALSDGVAILSQAGERVGFLPFAERCTSMDFMQDDGDNYWVAVTTSKAAHVARFKFLKLSKNKNQ